MGKLLSRNKFLPWFHGTDILRWSDPIPAAKSHTDRKNQSNLCVLGSKIIRWPGNVGDSFTWFHCFFWWMFGFCSVLLLIWQREEHILCRAMYTSASLLKTKTFFGNIFCCFDSWLITCVTTPAAKHFYSGRNQTEDTKQREFPPVKRRRHRSAVLWWNADSKPNFLQDFPISLASFFQFWNGILFPDSSSRGLEPW